MMFLKGQLAKEEINNSMMRKGILKTVPKKIESQAKGKLYEKLTEAVQLGLKTHFMPDKTKLQNSQAR